MPLEEKDDASDKLVHRERVVTAQWIRNLNPDGVILPRPPPMGMRTANGLIWGHSLSDFMWIQRIPNINVLTIGHAV